MKLFGYESYFKFFIKLYEKKKLPNSILFSGLKGLGKATFAYHFINYLLSKNELNKYSINDFSINENNSTYKLLLSNVHPNFFSVNYDDSEKNISILKIRDLIKFLNKTSYSKNIKIVLIDNAENLNLIPQMLCLNLLRSPRTIHFFSLFIIAVVKFLKH